MSENGKMDGESDQIKSHKRDVFMKRGVITHLIKFVCRIVNDTRKEK